MTMSIEGITEKKKALLVELQGVREETLKKIQLLKEQLQAKETLLSTIEKELSALDGNHSETHDKQDSELELHRCDKAKPTGIAATFCNMHNLPLKKIDDYILVILYNIDRYVGKGATAEEVEDLLTGAGYASKAVNFNGIIYGALSRLKEQKLARGASQGKNIYYTISSKGSKQVQAMIAKSPKPTVAIGADKVLESLKGPGTLAEIVSRIGECYGVTGDPLEFSNSVKIILKQMVADGRVKVALVTEDGLSVYQKC